MKNNIGNYEEALIKILKDPEESIAYLQAAANEDPSTFCLALEHVLKAQANQELHATILNALKQSLLTIESSELTELLSSQLVKTQSNP